MKKNTTIGSLILMTAAFSFTLSAQTDSVRVRTSTSETVTTGSYNPPPPVPVEQTTPPPAPVSESATADESDDRHSALRKTEFGIRYYPTFSAFRVRTYNNETVGGTLTMSHGFGAFIGHNFTRHFGLVLEVDYNQMSQKYRDRNLDRVVHINYLNIPVLLSFNTDKTYWVNWNFVAGPQFGLNVGSKITTNGNANADTLQAVVAVKEGDAGLAYGTGLEFALNKDHTFRLDVGFRGFLGLVNMDANQTSSNPDTYNIILRTARKYYAGYIGLAWMF